MLRATSQQKVKPQNFVAQQNNNIKQYKTYKQPET